MSLTDQDAPPTVKRRVPALALTLVVAIPLAVLLSWPQLFGAQRAPIVAQLISFRAPLALGLVGLAVVAGIVARVRRRWAIAAAIAIAAAVGFAVNAGVLLSRGTGESDLHGELTVVAWNTQGGATPPEDVAALVLSSGADIVSLPEMDEIAAAEVARLVKTQGGPAMTSSTVYADSIIPTSVLIAADLGAYELDATAGSTPGLPSGAWRPVDGDGPVIVAAHPAPPLFDSMEDWRAGLEWVASWCAEPNVIIAGDLNATVDHLSGLGSIDHCADAASNTGGGTTGTWPSTTPAWLASPIDHVLAGPGWAVRGSYVPPAPVGGTDHRALVAVLGKA